MSSCRAFAQLRAVPPRCGCLSRRRLVGNSDGTGLYFLFPAITPRNTKVPRDRHARLCQDFFIDLTAQTVPSPDTVSAWIPAQFCACYLLCREKLCARRHRGFAIDSEIGRFYSI